MKYETKDYEDNWRNITRYKLYEDDLCCIRYIKWGINQRR